MSGELIIHRNRTNIVPLSLGFNVSGDTFSSEIRRGSSHTSPLLATFSVTFLTNGVDGELVLTLPEEQLANVTVKYGFMDLKRTSNGLDLPVFLEPLKVKFQGVVTQ